MLEFRSDAITGAAVARTEIRITIRTKNNDRVAMGYFIGIFLVWWGDYPSRS
jgi:hypothetical protein